MGHRNTSTTHFHRHSKPSFAFRMAEELSKCPRHSSSGKFRSIHLSCLCTYAHHYGFRMFRILTRRKPRSSHVRRGVFHVPCCLSFCPQKIRYKQTLPWLSTGSGSSGSKIFGALSFNLKNRYCETLPGSGSHLFFLDNHFEDFVCLAFC